MKWVDSNLYYKPELICEGGSDLEKDLDTVFTGAANLTLPRPDSPIPHLISSFPPQPCTMVGFLTTDGICWKAIVKCFIAFLQQDAKQNTSSTGAAFG